MSANNSNSDECLDVGMTAPEERLFWSAELEELHEESSRSHFLDVWTRRAILDSLDSVPEWGTVVDLGCSSGYLLEDLRQFRGFQRVVGLDFLYIGLQLARRSLSDASLLQGDACALPFANSCFDALVSANLLEHVPNDLEALQEMRRVLKPGGTAAIVVPSGPRNYDYYDRFLQHQRRYAHGELAAKARLAGFGVKSNYHIGWVIYPAFWIVKKCNRLKFDSLVGEALADRVANDIAHTRDSRVGHLTTHLERALRKWHLSPPFGIREVITLQRLPD
jgi:SAM-dependent methyltransferase